MKNIMATSAALHPNCGQRGHPTAKLNTIAGGSSRKKNVAENKTVT